jgi:predicted RNA-binding Zn-ribbon protein involved in translation (DUF1610 family)
MYSTQLELLEEIQSVANINIVNCGHCGDVFLHRIIDIDEKDTDIQCPHCGLKSDPSDHPDYYYEGWDDYLSKIWKYSLNRDYPECTGEIEAENAHEALKLAKIEIVKKIDWLESQIDEIFIRLERQQEQKPEK